MNRVSFSTILLFVALSAAGCQTAGAYCDNSCRFANDGECDDGRSGAATGYCALGTDCNDCGPNMDAEPDPDPDPDPGGDGPTAPRDRCAWPGRTQGFGSVRVDGAGWVYAWESGETGTLHRIDPATASFEPVGAVSLSGASGVDYDVFAGDGGVYWADGELVRFDFEGNERWRVSTPEGAVLAVPGGETVVIGEAIRRFAADGTERWSEPLDGASADRRRADVNAAGQVAVLLQSAAGDGSAVLRRYGPDGSRLGSDVTLVDPSDRDAIHPYGDGGGVALLEDGDVAVTALGGDDPGSILVSVTRYAMDGSITWASQIPRPSDSELRVNRVEYLRASVSGDLVLAGFADGTLSGQSWGGLNDAIVVKLAGSDGSVEWIHQEGNGWDDSAQSPVFTLSGNVIVRLGIGTSRSSRDYSLVKLDGNTGDETSGGPIDPDPSGCSGPTDFSGSYGTPCTPSGLTWLTCEMVGETAYLYRCDPDTCLFEGHPCDDPAAVCSSGTCVVREGP